MKRFTCLAFLLLSAAPIAAQNWEAGASGDDRHQVVYLTRYFPIAIAGESRIVGWATGSWIHYELTGGDSVDSPGLSGGATYRRTSANLAWGIGGGYEMRWTERETSGIRESETESGPVVLGDLEARLAPRFVAVAGANWSGANDWVGSRGMLLYEISDRFRAGPEAGMHGNDDLRVRELGGVIGIGMDRSWLYLRGGQARSRERGGIERAEPYFSVAISRPF